MKDALFLSYVAEFATVLQSDEGIRFSEMEIFGPVMTEVWKSSGWPLRFYVRADRMAGRVLRMACGARTLNLTSLALPLHKREPLHRNLMMIPCAVFPLDTAEHVVGRHTAID